MAQASPVASGYHTVKSYVNSARHLGVRWDFVKTKRFRVQGLGFRAQGSGFGLEIA